MPRRRPEPGRWLAGRLRRIAAVALRAAERLSGGPAGRPTPDPEPEPVTPVPGPPAHWRELVAAHAPGLLRGEGIGVSGVPARDSRTPVAPKQPPTPAPVPVRPAPRPTPESGPAPEEADVPIATPVALTVDEPVESKGAALPAAESAMPPNAVKTAPPADAPRSTAPIRVTEVEAATPTRPLPADAAAPVRPRRPALAAPAVREWQGPVPPSEAEPDDHPAPHRPPVADEPGERPRVVAWTADAPATVKTHPGPVWPDPIVVTVPVRTAEPPRPTPRLPSHADDPAPLLPPQAEPMTEAESPWPDLPDDGPLWTTPAPAWAAADVRRLEREQVGG